MVWSRRLSRPTPTEVVPVSNTGADGARHADGLTHDDIDWHGIFDRFRSDQPHSLPNRWQLAAAIKLQMDGRSRPGPLIDDAASASIINPVYSDRGEFRGYRLGRYGGWGDRKSNDERRAHLDRVVRSYCLDQATYGPIERTARAIADATGVNVNRVPGALKRLHCLDVTKGEELSNGATLWRIEPAELTDDGSGRRGVA